MDEFYTQCLEDLIEMGINNYIKTEVVEEMGIVYAAAVGFTDDAPEELVAQYLQLCAMYGIEIPWLETEEVPFDYGPYF